MALNASKCKYLGSRIPLGYSVDENKNFILHNDDAKLVKTFFEMFVAGNNYVQLANWANERSYLTSLGKKFNKSSFPRIFANRMYLGKYVYMGHEVDGGVPRIIEDNLFIEAQKVLAVLAQAPSRGKAKVDYLLSQKFLCGTCSSNMNGVSATDKRKIVHNYYRCHENRTGGKCNRKVIRKQYIEDEIVNATLKTLTDEFIDIIAAETYLLIQAEMNDTEIKRLDGIVAENQTAINNLMKVLMLGKVTDVILAQIEQLENTNKELKSTIETEKANLIDYTYADIKKWLLHFRNLDYSKTKNRRDLIDTFIYRIIIYDKKVKILYHLKGGQRGELLLNIIFPEYPDGENSLKEKETSCEVSNSSNTKGLYGKRVW